MNETDKLQKVINHCNSKIVELNKAHDFRSSRPYEVISNKASQIMAFGDVAFGGEGLPSILSYQMEQLDPEKPTYAVYAKALEIYNS